jgi:hypothetical protein
MRSIRATDLRGSRLRKESMKKLALALAAAALLLPGAARSAACSPLNCAPSQFTLAHGTLLGFRSMPNKPVTVVDLASGTKRWVLPAGLVGGNLLVHQNGRTLAWYDVSTGTRIGTALLPDVEYVLGGVSQDGTRAVATRRLHGNTRIAIVSRTSKKLLTVPGVRWGFDALYGNNLFLIHNFLTGGYEIRLLHVVSGRLERRPLKDPHESGRIWGSPFSRLSSDDRTYLFTLYIGSNGGAMVHELNVKSAIARCVDLPGTGDYGSAATWTMQVSPDGKTLWMVNPGYGRVVGIDVASRKVTTAFRIDLAYWNNGTTPASALSPDGTQIALADGETVALIDLSAKKIVQRDPAKKVIALGYAPDGATLWKLH